MTRTFFQKWSSYQQGSNPDFESGPNARKKKLKNKKKQNNEQTLWKHKGKKWFLL